MSDEQAMLDELNRLETELEESHEQWAGHKARVQGEVIQRLAAESTGQLLNITREIETVMLADTSYLVAKRRHDQAMQSMADFRKFWRQIGELLPEGHPFSRHGTFPSVRVED